MNVVIVVSGPTASAPLVALLPVQPPLAVQVVASVEFQVSVVEPPLSTSASAAVSETVGDCAALTCTVTDALAEPPEPEQVKVKVVSDASGPTPSLPAVCLDPDQPLPAVQLLALVELQVSDVESPLSI